VEGALIRGQTLAALEEDEEMVKRLLALVTVAQLSGARAVVAAPDPANASAAQEDARAIEARKACVAGEVDRGIKLLADYLASTDDVTAIYNMGRCYQQNGLGDKALLQFREYLRKARELVPEDRQEVEGYIRELEADQARRDERDRAAGLRAVETGAPPSRSGAASLRRAAYLAGGVGLVALGAGVAFGLKVRSTNDTRANAATWREFQAHQDDGQTAQSLQWVAYGTAAAALAAGITCYVLGLQAPAERALLVAPWAAPAAGGGLVRGTF
jgi:hypothetical protein